MTTTADTPPVVIRQRVRTRLGVGRPRPESAVQTHPRGPQDEYVRFSAVNQGSGGRAPPTASRTRDSTRLRTKARPNHHRQSEVQSEGNEYVRIQSANRPSYPKTIVQAAAPTAARTTTTTIAPLTTTEETQQQNDDIEYGFIRPPNFNNQPHHQLSSKFRAPESQVIVLYLMFINYFRSFHCYNNYDYFNCKRFSYRMSSRLMKPHRTRAQHSPMSPNIVKNINLQIGLALQ